MHCGEFEKSSWDRYGNHDQEVLLHMAQRYMEAQPAVPYTYRVSSINGLKRGLDYRYEMDMTSRFPRMENGQFVYAWGKLWSEEEAELPFSLSCYGPVTLYVNGQLAHHANIEQEVFPEQSSWFRLKLKGGWNHFVWQFMKTGTGCGAMFGSGSIKGFPLHFVIPHGAAEGAEGILFTAPVHERRLAYASSEVLASDEELVWHPPMSWQEDVREQEQEKEHEHEQEQESKCRLERERERNQRCAGKLRPFAAARIFGACQRQAVLAWTSVQAAEAGLYMLSGQYRGELIVMCNNKQVHLRDAHELQYDPCASAPNEWSQSGSFNVQLPLKKGKNDVWIWMIEHNGIGMAWERLKSPQGSNDALIPAAPIEVKGSPDGFLYSGPYEQPLSLENTVKLQTMSTLHQTLEGPSYWRVDLPGGYVRPFAEASHYGRWNYPLGVTLYGLLRLENEAALQYALGHIESCAAYYSYSRWDAKLFGAPGINHQLAGMDSLDDCGSFGATMLTAHAQHSIVGADCLSEEIAQYISKEQSRLSDGTLYRIKGSTKFMMDTLWCDDLYMSVPFLVRYSLQTGQQCYMDDAIHQLLQYKSYLFEPSLSIMHHVYDMKFHVQNGAFWGRGNGWVLFSLAELLKHVDVNHPKREALLLMFTELSAGCLALQGARGLWHQVLNDHESYEESSCTSMFAYAYAIGVQKGWYEDAELYIESARKAWVGLKKAAIDEKGNVYGVCRGSGFAHHSYYYKYDLMPRLNDTHGIGIIMLAGIEVGKMNSWLEVGGTIEAEL